MNTENGYVVYGGEYYLNKIYPNGSKAFTLIEDNQLGLLIEKSDSLDEFLNDFYKVEAKSLL